MRRFNRIPKKNSRLPARCPMCGRKLIDGKCFGCGRAWTPKPLRPPTDWNELFVVAVTGALFGIMGTILGVLIRGFY